MQIDFHHTATYAIARIAGFKHEDAEVIAHASQYVDDSTTSGFLRFSNGMRFRREATAHPMVDAKNLDNDEGAMSWLPFHFLPGAVVATGAEADQYRSKLVCRPDSLVAKAMMAAAISAKDQPHALHRLGITAHVFVDTFAHQGFIGQLHPLNGANDVQDSKGESIDVRILAVAEVPPMGHGQVNTCPDRPFLSWSYTDSSGATVPRDNPADFMLAADRLCQEFRRYLKGDPTAEVQGLGPEMTAKFATLFATFDDEDGDLRHGLWIEALGEDCFGFGAVSLNYVGKGIGSWKHLALGEIYLEWEALAKKALAVDTAKQSMFQHIGAALSDLEHKAEAISDKLGVEPIDYPFTDAFLTSDYKKFHDAASDQRHDIFRKILPSFGIYAS